MEPFIGQIIMFAGNFAPRGWAFCDGQLLQITQNTSLFSILGTTYGGDGRTSFGLPDLRGRVAVHPGTGPGLSAYRLGQKGGAETVTLQKSQMPSHNHAPKLHAVADDANESNPTGAALASARNQRNGYRIQAPDVEMIADSITENDEGGDGAHDNVQPLQCVNFIIALQGVFPSRN